MVRPGAISSDRFERLQKLNSLFAQGGYTMTELASRFGVTPAIIARDRDFIRDNWWREEENKKTRDKRLQRLKELEQVKRLALESYHRSRQDREELTTRYDKTLCEECNGTGKLPKCTCLNCEGIGYVTEEIITRKVSGTPGDAAFLNVAKSVVVEMCKLEALHKQPELKVQHVISGGVRHSVDIEQRYKDVDPELVIQAKAALARLEEAAKVSIIDGEFTKISAPDSA